MKRRAMIGLMVAAPTMLKQAMKEAENSGNTAETASVSKNEESLDVEGLPPTVSGYSDHSHRVINEIENEFFERISPNNSLPYWLENKRSWSQSFKHGILLKEQRDFRALMKKLREDDAFREKIVALFL